MHTVSSARNDITELDMPITFYTEEDFRSMKDMMEAKQNIKSRDEVRAHIANWLYHQLVNEGTTPKKMRQLCVKYVNDYFKCCKVQ